MNIVLTGGGWADPSLYRPLLTAAGSNPVIACAVLDDDGSGPEIFARFESALTAVAPCRPAPVYLLPGVPFDPTALGGADGLLVCGGLTPGYAEALAPAAAAIRDWLAAGRPYAGMSAGAAVAARRAVVGGYLLEGRVVCPPDTAEDLDPVTVVDGLGLVEFAVDVHAAQWGTLGRLCAAVAAGLVPAGVAVDEDTALLVDGASTSVVGSGAVHVVQPVAGGIFVRTVPAGGTVELG